MMGRHVCHRRIVFILGNISICWGGMSVVGETCLYAGYYVFIQGDISVREGDTSVCGEACLYAAET